MRQNIPTVRCDTLVYRDNDQDWTTKVDTEAWYAWLDTASAFAFHCPQGRFTARKESSKDRSYWKAYRRRLGKVRQAYLGKGDELTLEILNCAATTLAAASCEEQPISEDQKRAHPPVHRDEYPKGASVPDLLPDRSPHGSQEDPQITTKLLPPIVRADLVARPRLIERLSEVLQHRLTLLSAPAGFGKTTLLGQWIPQAGCPVAWVSLDASDNDPTRFWAYVIGALQEVCPGIGDAPMAILRSSGMASGISFFAALANEMARLPTDVILVLDDYHLIEGQAVQAGMQFLLDHLPGQLRLVIAGRADPALPLARLRGRGQLLEIRASDLAFTLEEGTTLLNGIDRLSLSAEEVAALKHRTEGWAVGLHLAGLSMRGCEDRKAFLSTFAGDQDYIADYLMEEVLRHQPERVATFLMRTAILDRLSGPLCEAVAGLGKGEGQAMLHELEAGNLFTVRLDRDRQWYRYHHLFADCLRTRLRLLDPDLVPSLHARACVWYTDQGLLSESVNHALASRDFRLAGSLIEQISRSLIKRGESVTVLGWLSALPEDLVKRRPFLCILRAHLSTGEGKLDAAEAQVQDAERCLGLRAGGLASPAEEAEGSVDVQSLLDHISAIRAAIAGCRRDLPLVVQISSRALATPSVQENLRAIMLASLGTAYRWMGDLTKASDVLAEATMISRKCDDLNFANRTLSQLASIQVAQGRLHEAFSTYRRALDLGAEPRVGAIPTAGQVHLGLASLHYEWNELDTAADQARRGIDLVEQTGIMDVLMFGYGVLGRLRQAEGDLEGALQVMDRAESLALAHNLTQELARIEIHRTGLWLKQGNVEAAVQWVRMSGVAKEEPNYLREAGQLMLAKVFIAQGKPAEAVQLLGQLVHQAVSAGRTRSEIRVRAVLALGLRALGRVDEAAKDLDHALALAEPEGYVRTFVDAGSPMAALMRQLLDAQQDGRRFRASPRYVHALLAVMGSAGSVGQRKHDLGNRGRIVESPLDALSGRELEVLRLIAAGCPPSEIARDLVVSLNTVKSHMRSIYGKLETHSATQTVAKARGLKLV